MNKFDKVCKMLEEKTYNTDNYITLIKNVDSRHTGKYAIRNIITNNIEDISYKTLDTVIKEFNLGENN